MFDYSLKRQIYNPSKIYGIDPALMRMISFSTSRNPGRVYENIVFLELKRRGREIYYWKSTEGKEVDFLLREGVISEAIQVSLDLTDPATREREIKGFQAASSAFPSARLTLLTEDEEEEMNNLNGTIMVVTPLWKWLLNLQ